MDNITERVSQPLTIETLSDYLEEICFAHGKTINGPLLAYWQRTLTGLTDEEFRRGCHEYSIGPQCQYWPQPGQIFRLARPEGDKQAEAQLMVERLFATLGPCGADAGTRAREKLPDVAWAYVENLGGWSKFASDMQLISGDPSAVKAHARNSIMGLMDRKKSGKPMLIGKDETPGLTSMAESFKILLPDFPATDDEGVD